MATQLYRKVLTGCGTWCIVGGMEHVGGECRSQHVGKGLSNCQDSVGSLVEGVLGGGQG